MDGTAKDSPGVAGCGGIFRNHCVWIMGCFALSVSIKHTLYAELFAAIEAIEIAHEKGLSLWLE